MMWQKIMADRAAALDAWDEEIQRWADQVESQGQIQGSHDPPPEMVGMEGVEPSYKRGLSPLRMPIPPHPGNIVCSPPES